MNKEKSLVVFDAPELSSIEKSKATQIKATFEPMAEMLLEFETSFNAIIDEAKIEITEEVTNKAKRLRLDIGKVRIRTETVRKEQKDEYLRAGKAIDGVSNILKWAVTDRENKLKEIENYFEIQEQERINEIQANRVEKLSVYLEDANERDLAGMDEDVWNAYFNTKKKEFEDIKAAEVQAEKDRIAKEKAEIAEQKRIKAENEKLKREAEAKEKAEIERKKKEDADRKLQEAKLKKEREAYESKLLQEKKAKEKIENDARIKQEELEAKIKAKEDAELLAKEKAEEVRQFEISKGDSEKVQDLIKDLKVIKIKYTFQSKNNQKIYSEVNILIDQILSYIETNRSK